jgi:threonine dehydrogenase-like Zn-dependent dehydrogenase
VRVGDLVTSEGMLYCGHCASCRAGHVNQCENLAMLGFSHPGAFAEYAMVHEKHCFNVESIAEKEGSADVAAQLASLVEPLGCAQNGMFIVGPGVKPGDHVAVFGCGPIGLGAIALARAAGAATITAFDQTAGRVQLASRMGATHSFNVSGMSNAEQVNLLRESTRGWGTDVVVEAAGAALHTMPVIESALAPGGTVVYLGRTGERAPVMLDVLVSKAARIVGSRGHAGYGIFPHIIDLIASGTLDLKPMITATAPLTDYARAFERSKTREDGKILLTQP